MKSFSNHSDKPPVNKATSQRRQKKIDSDIEAFLNAGGKVDVLEGFKQAESKEANSIAVGTYA